MLYNLAVETWGTIIVTDNALRKMTQYGLRRNAVMDAFNHPNREEWSPVPNCKITSKITEIMKLA